MLARNVAIIPMTSAADLTGQEGRFVNVSGAIVGANSAVIFGVITEGYPVGMNNSVAVCSGSVLVKVKLGGTVTAGAWLISNAAGAAVAGTTGQFAAAQALEGGTADELIEAVTVRPFAI